MLNAPFKLNQDRHHQIPKQKHKVMNWRAYVARLRQRGNLMVWFNADEAYPPGEGRLGVSRLPP